MSDAGIDSRIAQLEELVAKLQAETRAARDRAEIENLFAQYMYLHNAFEDERIIELWAAPDTPGIRAQYSNNGVYNTWETITYYHRDRPRPQGKLIFHYLTTPMIEVAGDGETAKGLWIAAGVESGLTDPEVAKQAPAYMYDKALVDGQRVWQHQVYLKYGVDFIKQDGAWKIWHFHCFETCRSPVGMGWVPFAAASQDESFNYDLMYFGDDGKPVFMPAPDGPAVVMCNPYRTDSSQVLEARPPVPYRTFSETFEY
jgi:hypothetical protein